MLVGNNETNISAFAPRVKVEFAERGKSKATVMIRRVNTRADDKPINAAGNGEDLFAVKPHINAHK